MAEFRRNRGSVKPSKAAERKTRVLQKQVEQTRVEMLALLDATKGAPGGPVMTIPRADQLVLAEMRLPQQHAYLTVIRTIAQRSLASIAPRVVWKLARKIENHLEPGDTRLMVEYLKGLGFLEPSTPQTDDEREAKMKKHAEYERMTLEDLKADVVGGRD